MGKDTAKAALLEAGKRLFLEKGYANAGLEAILHEAGIPRGSFYYYFRSKEDFGLQVIDGFAAYYDEIFDQSLNDTKLTPLQRLRQHFEGGIQRLATQECRNGCPIGRLSQELADESEAFRSRLEQIFGGWVERIANCVREAQEQGEIAAEYDPNRLAEFWMSSWQGAILRARMSRSTAPLRNFVDLMFDQILRPCRQGHRTSTGPLGSESTN